MVQGLDSFKKWFAKFQDQYVVIGGSACDTLFEDQSEPFRETRDIDVVLIVESLTPEFGKKFWQYIKMAGYQNLQKSTGKPEFYRFYSAKQPGFPFMIELLAQAPDYIKIPEEARLTPIGLGDSLESLSAILLDPDYYNLLQEGRTVVDGLSVLKAPYLMLFKIKAWLNLKAERETNPSSVHGSDLRKHKNDVIRLTRLLSTTDNKKIILPDSIYNDVIAFRAAMEQEFIDPRQFGIRNLSKREVLDRVLFPFSKEEKQNLEWGMEYSL